ncbi:AI-2E family transporter [Glycomyces sp. TRM65418]|uniref:AI-2E family transporter n=1 Tax=Glycomyces sp. TRM65418 TaxID=2867006 RepID=UPI001CE5F30E|nr:AI-2E family transporter [Glycomyces sp. TRM65418]MCC3763876.1 AI-2E family transporter [Glycomyces sp. TRM65418]QZD53579.1 AI-2E family transporter [Glycomyces sp. TRM65418]
MSRFRRTAARARQLWVGMRLNPVTERALASRESDPEPDIPKVTAGDIPPELDQAGSGEHPERRYVPLGLAIGAAWSWRLLVIGAMIAVILFLLSQVTMVIIPVAISFLLAAMLQPPAAWLIRHGWNKSLASLLMLVAGLAAVSAILTFVVQQFIAGIPDFYDSILTGLRDAQAWLEAGPYGLDGKQVAVFLADIQDNITSWYDENQQTIVQTGLDVAGSTASGLGNFVAGLFLVLFTTYFFIRDGRRIWTFLTGMLPRTAADPLAYAGSAGWSTLVQYMRTIVVVAAVDAIFIGLGLWLLGVPLWLPLTTLIFLGAFIPIVGATISGGVAVVVALVGTPNGLVTALIVLGIVLAVQQLESNLLQPFLMSRAVKLHPLAIVLAVTAGGFVWGVIGALVAVPLLAIVNGTVRALNRYLEARREAQARGLDGEEATAEAVRASTETADGDEPAAERA